MVLVEDDNIYQQDARITGPHEVWWRTLIAKAKLEAAALLPPHTTPPYHGCLSSLCS